LLDSAWLLPLHNSEDFSRTCFEVADSRVDEAMATEATEATEAMATMEEEDAVEAIAPTTVSTDATTLSPGGLAAPHSPRARPSGFAGTTG